MEMWPLYLSKIISIKLNNNLIQGFTNTFGWYLYQNYPSLASTSTIDLQYNSIISLSDSTIQQYGVCSFSDYSRFINNYFNLFWLDNNPINCNCTNSQRLVSDSITILNSIPSLLNSNLYKSFCKTPTNYIGKHIINFDTFAASISHPYCTDGSSRTTQVRTTTIADISASLVIQIATTTTNVVKTTLFSCKDSNELYCLSYFEAGYCYCSTYASVQNFCPLCKICKPNQNLSSIYQNLTSNATENTSTNVAKTSTNVSKCVSYLQYSKANWIKNYLSVSHSFYVLIVSVESFCF
jgi:hypothetical protein